MHLAVIDLGTNSVRFDIHEIEKDGKVELLYREKLMVRLGQGVFIKGKLDPEACKRTLLAFVNFKKIIDAFRADKVIAFGTSALRDASDSSKLISLIEKKTGIQLRVISGQEEARLIARGILANAPQLPPRFGIIDIGGGSIELILCRKNSVEHANSFNLGVARLQQIFLKTCPPKIDLHGNNPIHDLIDHFHETLVPIQKRDRWKKVDTLLGSSGTIKALGKVLKAKGQSKKGEIKRSHLEALVKRMRTLSPIELLAIPGLEARRADLILPGALALLQTMKILGAKQVLPTEFSLRDGILDEEIEIIKRHEASHLPFQMDQIFDKAIQLGADENHFRQILTFSSLLFDRLQRIHKLKPFWKTYLSAAAVLHDVGYAISPAHHEKHGYYIVKNSNFPSLQDWEVEFIAQLVLHHKEEKIEGDRVSFIKNKPVYRAFLVLESILRIADALDHTHHSVLRLKTIKVTRNEILLKLKKHAASHLEAVKVEQKKVLFEKVFKKKLKLEISY